MNFLSQAFQNITDSHTHTHIHTRAHPHTHSDKRNRTHYHDAFAGVQNTYDPSAVKAIFKIDLFYTVGYATKRVSGVLQAGSVSLLARLGLTNSKLHFSQILMPT